ncbi:MAG: ParB family protein [Thiopseudomonas sp.]
MSSRNKLTQELIDQQLNVKGFSSGSGPISRLSDPIADTPMVVTLDQLRPYENNPRRARNPLYDELKESIRARGLDQAPPITRRPDEEHFIIRSGGNTRLQILNELWRETKDERFYKINCLFKPWESEINALAGHLSESELHGPLSFIDKALGVAKMKQLYEEESGESLSLRKLSERLKIDGYPVSISHLSRMLDCVEFVLPALPNTLMQGLGRPAISSLIMLKNNLTKVWAKYDSSDFFEFWVMVLSGLDTGVEDFSFDVIQDQMLSQMSVMLGQDYGTLELDLAVEGGVHTPVEPAAIAPVPAAIPVQTSHSQSSQQQVADTDSRQQEPQPEPNAARSMPGNAPVQEPSASTTQESSPVPTEKPEERTPEDTAAFIDAHIVTPSQESDAMTRTRHLTAEANGENMRTFEEAVLESIPITAGGPSISVVDVWYIEKRIHDVFSLRHNIWLLVQDICSSTGVGGFFQTDEGLGFGVNTPTNDGSNLAIGTQILLMSILRQAGRYADEAPIPIQEVLFGQMMIGAFDIQVGHSEAVDSGIERLPDAEFVKLFRVMRLARVLVDLVKSTDGK